MSTRRRRPIALLVVLTVVAAGLSTLLWAVQHGAPGSVRSDDARVRRQDTGTAIPAAATTPSGAATPAGAAAVLAAWDARRAAAYAAADLAALRALYAPGSRTGDRDAATLRAYRDRGLRVVDLRSQLLAVRVLSRGARRMRLAVTDRLAGATAVGPGIREPLPRGQRRTRTLDLARVAGHWVVVEVRS